MIPVIEYNNTWSDPLMDELVTLWYKTEQVHSEKYIHWCELSKDPLSHPHAGSDEFIKNVPTSVIQDAKSNKAVIVFSTWEESTNPIGKYEIQHCIDFDLQLEDFCKATDIPTNNVVWVSGDLKVKQRQKSKLIRAFGFTCYGHDILRHIKYNISEQWNLTPITERKFEKDMMCFQRLMKPGRLYWTVLLKQNNMFANNYVSVADRIGEWSYLDKARAFWFETRDNLKHMTSSDLDLKQFWYELADIGLMVPITVDVPDHGSNWCAGWDTTLSSLPFYNTSFCSVITETDIQSEGLFVSEAGFRPFIYQHPCVWVAQAGIVKQMKDWGFETWDWLASEEYDNEPLMMDRLQMCMTSIKEMISKKEDKKVLERIHEQNLYNWNHLQTKFIDIQRNKFIKMLNDIITK